MTPRKYKGKQRALTPQDSPRIPENSTRTPQSSTPQRPITLLKRVSSSLISIFPRISSRRGSLETDRDGRPGTAPVHDHVSVLNNLRNRSRQDDTQQIPSLHVEPAHSEGDCIYDRKIYYSFPSIEDEGCGLCLNPFSGKKPKRFTSDKPCEQCRTKGPFSHLASPLKRSRGQARSSTAVDSSRAHLINHSNSLEEGPRPVSPARAAQRIGNPARKSSLPVHLKPSYPTHRSSSAHPPSSSHQTRTLSPPSFSTNHDTRPISPKLHHIHLFPHAQSHPYMHKHEVEAHLAAIRAGSPSPLRKTIDELTPPSVANGPFQDFTRTVFYGTTIESAARVSRRSAEPEHRQGVVRRVSMVFEERRTTRSGSGRTHRHRNRDRTSSHARAHRDSPQARVYQDSHPTSASDNAPTHARPSTAQKQLEFPNGDEDEYPNLRGGGAFKLKKCILTCPASYLSDSDVDEDIPAPRTPVPERIVRAMRMRCGRARLPHALRRAHAEAKRSGVAPNVACQSSSTHQVMPNLRGGGDSPPLSQLIPVSPTLPMPTLRGGSGGDSSIRLPPTLFWLAGGKGKPVRIGGWKQQRGEKRMGGLLGLAVYGARAGREYGCEEGDRSGVREGSVGSSGVSVNVSVGGDGEVGGVAGSSSSSVSMKGTTVASSVRANTRGSSARSGSSSSPSAGNEGRTAVGSRASSLRTVAAEQTVASGEGDASPEGPPSDHGEEMVEEQGGAEGAEAGNEEQNGNAGDERASAEANGAGNVAEDPQIANAVGESAARS